MRRSQSLAVIVLLLFFAGCALTADREAPLAMGTFNSLRLLALGDSYTIGQGVAEPVRWPEQFRQLLSDRGLTMVDIEYRAVTGWTTNNLLYNLENSPPGSDYDVVTVLIGVNNQFRSYPEELFQRDLNRIIDLAESYVESTEGVVVLISIPDYGRTPYGQNLAQLERERITEQLNRYNEFSAQVARERGHRWVDISDISRRGASDPSLIAADGLHLSAKAYSEIAERVYGLLFD